LRACRLFVLSCVALAFGTAVQAASPALQSAPAATQAVQFEVFLPLRHQAQLDALLLQLHDQNSPLYRHWLTPQEFTARFGADPDSVARVERALQRRGLVVDEVGARSLSVSGTSAAVRSGLGLDLRSLQTARGMRVVAAHGAVLPAELTNEGAVVAAFRPVVIHKRHGRRVALDSDLPQNRYGPTGPYWFTDIKQAYDMPSYKALTGKGVTIAIVMSNDFLDSDMALYFGHEHLPVPRIVRVPVKGGAPFDPDGSFEVSLDIQQAGGMAPKATIRAYNLPDLSDDSILRAYNRIVQHNAADIVSSSFGGAELFYTAAYNGGTDYTDILQIYESIFKQGNAQGITFVASSGDSGGLGATTPDYFSGSPSAHFIPGVEHPAVSPHVTAVGGTNLVTTNVAGSLQSRYVTENAYGDPELPYDPYGLGSNVSGGYWGSGGGESVIFAKPAYQYLVPTHSTMRTVPDVSLQMGGCPLGISQLPCGTPRSASVVAVGGGLYGVIGTSVSAPGFAGVLALFEQALGGQRLGNVNGLLYTEAALQSLSPGLGFFHRNIDGFNGYDYTARVYDRVVGVGTPRVRNMILTPQLPAAGDPQSPSNP
ncbi:MAG TPA: S53 family peptidase, partial [Caldimonas sp.]|nr:S53 family peptidase [Caldimonas sp.]